MNEELELKYVVEDVDRVRAWLDRELLADRGLPQWRRLTMSDRYVDTEDGALAAAGYGARLRRSPGGTIVGLKADIARDGALHTRREIEATATDSLDPNDWPGSEARDIVRRIADGRPLTERFVLDQVRHERQLDYETGRCMLSLDEALVRLAGHVVGKFHGLEVELRAGERSLLSHLARHIEASRLVSPEPRSKMALAQQLIATREADRSDARINDLLTQRQPSVHAGAPRSPQSEV